MGNIISFFFWEKSIDYIDPKDRPQLNWPHKDKWDDFILNFDNWLSTFQASGCHLETLLKLNQQIYSYCLSILGKKKYKKKDKLNEKFKLREKLIQQIYKKKFSPRPTCADQDLSDLFYSQNSGQEELNTLEFEDNRNSEWDNFDDSEFTLTEFNNILSIRRNKKPKYDGLSYELVYQSTKLKEILLGLFNKIKQTGKLPEYWCHGFGYATYKGAGEFNQAKNFRPIIKCDTFSSLYWHLSISRLARHFKKHNILNNEVQKAYQVNILGTEENLFIHQQLIKHCDAVVYLDLKNAFGSLQPDFIRYTLKLYGVPENWRELLLYFIENRKIHFGKVFKTWNRGVSQGMTLSNMLFILCLNVVIDRTINKFRRTHGIKIMDISTFLLQAFADDLVLYGKNLNTIQEVLDFMVIQLESCGFKLQGKKSVAQYLNPNLGEGYKVLKIKNIAIPNILTKKEFKYLGQLAIDPYIIDPFEKIAEELKNQLDSFKSLFEEKLTDDSAKDYWYAYRVAWLYKIKWFLRVHDFSDQDAEKIESVEREWFNSIAGLEDRINDECFKNRRDNARAIRFKVLSSSTDARIVSLYKKSMGDRYKEVENIYLNKPNINVKTGFKGCFYI